MLYHSSFGSPAAGMLMETLIASGIGRLVMLGQAGSLSSRCRIGSVVLPSFGVREEGTSYHYLPPAVECRPSPILFERLRTALEPIAPVEGGVWSTDAPYRETRQKVELYARQGVLAVEMECTALMSIAMYRNVEFAAVLVITDELFREKWEEGFQSENLRSAEERVSKALAESVDYLIQNRLTAEGRA
ncbi:MAG: nucleoside phosphorylase [Firmicutes bacterium]|nr:nucleoside phosphorylase [Candidatus Fermentithermobacillaceae bacterium]